MRFIRLSKWLFILSTTLLSLCARAEVIQITTENLPPYSYQEQGVLKGLSTEVVQAVMAELHMDYEIRLYPWARALMLAQTQENTLIYSIGRNASREQQFKWVGVVAPVDFYLFSTNTAAINSIQQLDDAKAYKIGTVINDVREQYLLQNGFEKNINIFPTSSYETNFRKLQVGRIDLWAMSEISAYHIVRQAGLKPADTLHKSYHFTEFSTEGYYMAFGLKTPDEIVERFRQALQRVKDSGLYQQILNKYLN